MRPTLVLIDGSGYLYRAYHVPQLQALRNRSGEPTGALFGVFNMVRAMLKTKPEHIAFVADAPGRTFRDDLYDQYKANRQAMPEDLHLQIEPMLSMVGALGLPILRIEGVEADDVIGTLALQAAAAGMDVIISTGDKDMAQLVNPNVKLINTMTNSTLDEAGVLTKFGVRPDQIIDYLALVGDSVDNIPGVDKCGPKTAAKWLAEHGTLDTVIANAHKVSGKIGDNLRTALAHLPLSRQLATIKTDVALEHKPHELKLREPQTDVLRQFFDRYEFKAALARNGRDAEQRRVGPVAAGHRAIERADQRHRRSVAGGERFVRTRADAGKIRRMDRQTSPGRSDFVRHRNDEPRSDARGNRRRVVRGRAEKRRVRAARARLRRRAAADQSRGCAGNAARNSGRPEQARKSASTRSTTSTCCRTHGIAMQGVQYDSMLESYVWNSSGNRHDMDTLAKKYLGYQHHPLRRRRPAKAPSRFRFRTSTSSARRNTPPKMPTSRCACTKRCGRNSKPKTSCARCWKTSKCRSCLCWRGWNKPAC